MSDFMKWLHAHYIKPYLDDVPQDEYYFWIDLLHNELPQPCREALEKAAEFTAIHAFILGLRTGQGLR